MIEVKVEQPGALLSEASFEIDDKTAGLVVDELKLLLFNLKEDRRVERSLISNYPYLARFAISQTDKYENLIQVLDQLATKLSLMKGNDK